MYPVLVNRANGSRLVLCCSGLSIGRSTDNDIVLSDDLTVSEYHAIIFRVNGKIYIQDLNSMIGTLVNGHRVACRRELRDGSEIAIGGTRWLLVTPLAERAS